MVRRFPTGSGAGGARGIWQAASGGTATAARDRLARMQSGESCVFCAIDPDRVVAANDLQGPAADRARTALWSAVEGGGLQAA